ncbi:MAG: hypothetical protein ACRDRT_12820 [Pseudonocardiaceae bacterium]
MEMQAGQPNRPAGTVPFVLPEKLVIADLGNAWNQPIRIDVRANSVPAAK